MAKAEAQAPSFEEALTELEKIVKGLESGSSDLKSAIDAYERGVTLKKLCETRLKEAEARIEKISIGDNGKASAEPFVLKE